MEKVLCLPIFKKGKKMYQLPEGSCVGTAQLGQVSFDRTYIWLTRL